MCKCESQTCGECRIKVGDSVQHRDTPESRCKVLHIDGTKFWGQWGDGSSAIYDLDHWIKYVQKTKITILVYRNKIGTIWSMAYASKEEMVRVKDNLTRHYGYTIIDTIEREYEF